MQTYPDYSVYSDSIEDNIESLGRKKSTLFAIECASRVIDVCDEIGMGKLLDFAIHFMREAVTAENPIEKTILELEHLRDDVSSFQEMCSNRYDELEGMKDLKDASPAGVKFFQANHAASSVLHAVYATLGEEVAFCAARAAGLAWAASLFDDSEKKWQMNYLAHLLVA